MDTYIVTVEVRDMAAGTTHRLAFAAAGEGAGRILHSMLKTHSLEIGGVRQYSHHQMTHYNIGQVEGPALLPSLPERK